MRYNRFDAALHTALPTKLNSLPLAQALLFTLSFETSAHSGMCPYNALTFRDSFALCYNLPLCERAQASQTLLRLWSRARRRLPLFYAAYCAASESGRLRKESAGCTLQSVR